MEKVKDLDKKKLVNELTQGKEFVKQLKRQIGPLASPEECDLLMGKILCTLEKSLSILNLKALLLSNTNNSTSSSSSISFPGNNNNNSPKSEVLDSSRDQLNKSMVSKKRKKSQQWTNQTSIFVKGPQEDGYSWRKYGQKDILGANHPRAYYRCTYRNTQGCLATKRVQKSDGNSTMFEVTYKGRHSCKAAQSEIFSLGNQKRHKHKTKQDQNMVIFNSEPNHKVENFNITTKEEAFTPFPLQLENIEETKFFSDSMAPFSSPIAPELSPYLSMLTSQNEEFGMEHMMLQSSDSDLTEFISTPTSISNSSFGGDCNFSEDFEPNLTFDIEEFFN